MAEHKPLVLINGRPSTLPDGDLPSGGLPAGGTIGQVVTKTGTGNGVAGWITPSGGDGGSVVVHERTVDFTVSRKSGIFFVAVLGVLTSQRILVSISGQMPAGVSFDELEMDPLTVTGFVSAADMVTLLVTSLSGPVKGQRNISMVIG